MATVKVTVRRNGSLRVDAPEGSIELLDADGHAYNLAGKTSFSLCRCGGSATRPFCDGSHKHNGFQSAECAIPVESKAEAQKDPQQANPEVK